MKVLYVLLALAAAGVAPASARPAPTAHNQVHTSHQERPAIVRPHDTSAYQRPWIEENNNLNPDFQLGGSW